MPANIALTGSLTGLSTVGGALGPASFSYLINDATKFYSQEIPVQVMTGAPVVHTVPDVGTQRLVYIKTSQDVTLTLNAEPVGLLKAGGILVRAGMANVTTITLDGNGALAGIVFVVIVGD